MKKLLPILAGTAVTGLIGTLLVTTFLNSSVKAQSPTPASTAPASVTVASASRQQNVSMDYVGSVKAIDQIKVLPIISGQVVTAKIHDGDHVSKGDVLFELGGLNGTKHPLQSQFDLAQTAVSNAEKALQAVKEGNAANLQSAEVMVQNAQHQAEALTKDLSVFDRNIAAAQAGENISQNSLDATNQNNQENIDKANYAIQGIVDSLNLLNAQRNFTFNNFNDQLSSAADNTAHDTIQKQIDQANFDYAQKFQTLQNQLQTARASLRNAQAASQLADNQIQAQLVQSQAQQDVLALNQSSAALKAGYDGQTTDALKAAQVGVTAAKAKNKASLLQAQAQLDTAKINLDSAKTQLEYLTIHAPIDGIITQTSARPGDLVSAQSVVTQIVNPQGFELNVSINSDDVDRVDSAQVEIGGKYLDVPIKSISPIADPSTKLVTVTLSLPNIFFRANQTLSTRITFKQPQGVTANQSIMVPVEALIIDNNNNKYVFVDNNGVAKKTPISVGGIKGDSVEILSGLQDTDQVIVQGSQNLVDGQPVVSN